MDVLDERSVREAIGSVVEHEGRLDVLVNNAGIGVAGSIEDTSIEEVMLQFDTNFFGAIRVIQAVLPHMRERSCGRIINIGPMAGQLGMPYQGHYSATKFAIEGITEALRLEVRQFGIDVVVIEPGDFKTAFTDNRIVAEAANTGPYAEQCRKTLDVYANDEINGADPKLVAELVERVIGERAPKIRYMVGMFSQKAGVVIKRVVGSRSFEAILRRHCHID